MCIKAELPFRSSKTTYLIVKTMIVHVERKYNIIERQNVCFKGNLRSFVYPPHSRCDIKTLLMWYCAFYCILISRRKLITFLFSGLKDCLENMSMLNERFKRVVLICVTIAFVGILINGVYIMRHKKVIIQVLQHFFCHLRRFFFK